ncbi:MAG TPA: YbfB/YjiJ family MFS transporter [Rhizomicrobium sp.]
MKRLQHHVPQTIAISGLAALAVIMGIGRFAFTPILPMMQADHGVTVAEGGWLASANYVGYLVGSLFAMRAHMRPRVAIRIGLVFIGVCTLAMGVEHHFGAWLILRAVPGFASAWVMVFLSAWVLQQLAQAGRGDLSGTVYAGVGAGIVFAGLACLALSHIGASSDAAWIFLGVTTFVVTALVWSVLGEESASEATMPRSEDLSDRTPEFWRLVFCYGAFGLGYIIPATFLPIMAKQAIPESGWFGWAWPAFGAAAMVSTLLAAKCAALLGQRKIWMLVNVVMALGVLVPIGLPGLYGIAVAALCVGGTFMVTTMAGIQEARRVAGGNARVLIAAMTSAFAVGQIIGPILVSGLVHIRGGFSYALIASAIPLLLAACLLSVNQSSSVTRPVRLTR